MITGLTSVTDGLFIGGFAGLLVGLMLGMVHALIILIQTGFMQFPRTRTTAKLLAGGALAGAVLFFPVYLFVWRLEQDDPSRVGIVLLLGAVLGGVAGWLGRPVGRREALWARVIRVLAAAMVVPMYLGLIQVG